MQIHVWAFVYFPQQVYCGLCQVESLAKKYEEKYKQVAELASKLAVEEAAYRDVQVCLFYTLEK